MLKIDKLVKSPYAALRVVYAAIVIICAACSSSSPDLDKGKFDGVDRAARTVRNVIASGADYQTFGKALKHMSDELAALKGRVRTDQEKEIVKEYSVLLSIYQDGGLLWKYKMEFVRYGFVPRGLIYVGQDVEPIVAKYRIPTETYTYEPTHQLWKSIPEASIQMIWANADSQMQIINNILSYR